MHKLQTRGGIADEELTYKSLIWLHPGSVEETASCSRESKMSPFGLIGCQDKPNLCKTLHVAGVWFWGLVFSL